MISPYAPIDERLTLCKQLYFIIGFMHSSWIKFAVIFYTIHNINPTQIGYLEATPWLVQIISVPIWGFLCDKTKNKKTILLTIVLIGCFSLLLLTIDSITNKGFVGIFPIIILFNCFNCWSVSDVWVVDFLDTETSRWGEARLYLALAWGINNLICSGLFYLFETFTMNFVVWIIYNIMCVYLIYYKFPKYTKYELENKLDNNVSNVNTNTSNNNTNTNTNTDTDTNNTNNNNNPMEYSKLFNAILSPSFIIFLLEQFIYFIGFSLPERFIFLYIIFELKAPIWISGICVIITILLELPLFNKSQEILNKFNYWHTYTMSIIVLGIRCYLYSLLTEDTVFWVFPIELLHGVSIALNLIGAIHYVKQNSPKEWTSTILSVRKSAAFLGFAIGAVVYGHLIEKNGSSRELYSGLYKILFVVLVVHLVVYYGFIRDINNDGINSSSKNSKDSKETLIPMREYVTNSDFEERKERRETNE